MCRARCFGLPLFSVNACEALTRKVGASADKEAALVGGVFHFKPDARYRLLALCGPSNHNHVCPLLDHSGQSSIFGRRRFVR